MKKLGFGMMRLPLLDANNNKDIDLETTKQMIDEYLAAGFTYFDTAYIYHGGASEKAFGKLVADRYDRSSYQLTTKMPIWLIKTAEDYETIFQKQLDRTHAGYFDYYFLHSLTEKCYDFVQSTGGFGFAAAKKEAGLIRHIGFSYHGKSPLLETILNEHPETELVQLQLNYFDWESESVEARKCYEVCLRHGVKVSVMEPIKGGSLADVPESAKPLLTEVHAEETPASFALRFAGSLDNIFVVLSGMSSLEQLRENMQIFDHFVPFTEKEYENAEKIRDIFEQTIAIKCTGCHYCTEDCPMNICIPEYFSLYNTMKRFRYYPSMSIMFEGFTASHGKPSDCIGCGNCEAHCPQNLDIRKGLADVAEALEKPDRPIPGTRQ